MTTVESKFSGQTPAGAPFALTRNHIAIAAAFASMVPVASARAESVGQTAAPVQFEIPAQGLSSALSSFAAQSHIQLIYDGDLAQDLRSTPIKGAYIPARALQRLLTATPVQARFTGPRTVTLERKALPVQTGGSAGDTPTLGKVTVSAKAGYDAEDPRNPAYTVPNASTATKTDTPILETPVWVQVVPQQVLKDQQAVRLEDALKNVSGVTTGFGFGGLEDTFLIRGFENSTKSWNLTQVYRDGALAVGALFSAADVDRIEVLKGPAAMLYGRLEPGGLINVVSKKPLATPNYSLQQQFGSFDTYRTTLGATGPVTSDGSLAYRLDFEYLDQDSFRDVTFNKQSFVSPKLLWNISDRTNILFEYQHFTQDSITDWGIPAIGNRPANVPISRFISEPSDQYDHIINSGGFTLSHAFNDQWKIQAKYYRMDDHYDTSEHNPTLLNPVVRLPNGTVVHTPNGTLLRTYYAAPHQYDSDFGMVNLTGKFNTFGMEHSLLVGGDYYSSGMTEDGVSLRQGRTSVFPSLINLYNPVYWRSNLASFDIANNSFAKIDEEWFGFYLQDQITIADHWHVLGGLRYDDASFRSSFNKTRSNPTKTDDNEVSGRAGVLYQPAPWFSVYGSYVEGFNAQGDGRMDNGASPLPERSRQYEAGLKGEWLDGRLTSTLAYYHLTKENLSVPHSNLEKALLGFIEQAGEARSQGVEFDIKGQLHEDWSLIGSYAYTDTEVTKDRDSKGGTGNQGHRLANVPLHSGSLWVQHQFGELGLPGLSTGLGVYLAGQRQGNLANDFQLPGYVRLDAMLKYVHKIGKQDFTLQFNVQNLLDQEYYVAARNRMSVSPAKPLNFIGSIRVDF
ncbi:MAG: TonB-dependent receptor [Methylococcaceae bacterium]|nr:TonB-dependent receptor [Methylococcaceae bacterium]